MGFMRILCGSCGQTWEVYSRDDYHDWKAMTCPHCFEQIDPGIWEKYILPGFGMMQDANLELLKDNDQYNGKPFAVSYIAENPVKDDLRKDMKELRIITERFVDTMLS